MIVDDHAGVRTLIRQIVELPHDVVRECANADEAIRAIPEFRPDFITMDVNMPGISGIEATRLIRSVFPSIRIAVISAANETILRQAAHEAGAFAFLSKADLSDVRKQLLDAGAFLESEKDAAAVSISKFHKEKQVLSVLMVEDDEHDLELVRRELERNFASVLHAVDNQKDLALALAEGCWDVVLTDHRLHGFDARKVIDMVSQASRRTPVICVAGDLKPGTVEALLGAGAHGFVSKNDLTQLCPAIRRVLSGDH